MLWSQRILLSSLVVVLLTVLPKAVSGIECLDSYFVIDLDIEPRNPEVNATWCDGKDSIRLQRLVAYSVERKFDVYRKRTLQLDRAQINELCGGFHTGATVRHRARNLQTLALTSSGWSYSTTSKCRFCLPEFDDVNLVLPEVNFDIVNGTLVQVSVPPSSAPSAPPTNAPSVGPAPERGSTPAQALLERRLKERLEKQLRRVLRKKINRNSCLRGSDSLVRVALTPVGTAPPSLVCPTE